jgi:hypothetical protein
VGVCQRGYSFWEYCKLADLSPNEFLKNDFHFKEVEAGVVNKLTWPQSFISMSDPRAKRGVDYIKSRGLMPDDDMFYDMRREGIVFPYYVDNTFCGAQVRLVKEYVDQDGNSRKVDTMPGTRLGLLFYGWNQQPLPNVKGLIVCEGAINALSLQQVLNHVYGGVVRNPWRAIATSGSGLSRHHIEVLQEQILLGKAVVVAPDSDEAGFKMYRKANENGACTHVAFTDSNMDWNDLLKKIGKTELAKLFMGSVTDV